MWGRGEGVIDVTALTPREKQVLDLLIAGKPPREIAAVLVIERHTVYLHLGSIRAKTKTASTLELAVKSLTE